MFAKFNYRCRDCGKTFDSGVTIGVGNMDIFLLSLIAIENINKNGKIVVAGHSFDTLTGHICNDNTVGVADFISLQFLKI